MPYGTLKVDNITYTNAGVDASTSVSGLVQGQFPNLTITGTISGATITGNTGNFTTITAVTGNFPNLTVTGTISGATITGNTGNFTTITAVTGIFTNTLSGAVVTAPSGSAANPTFVFTGDSDTGLYSPGANQLAVSTSGTGRLFVDASGRVGVGTATPSTIFQCVGGASGTDTRITIGNSAAAIQAGVDGSNFAFIGTSQNQPFYFYTNGSERLRITASGLVGIGTSSPGGTIDLVAESANGYGLRMRGRAADNYASLQFLTNDGTTQNAYIGATASVLAVGTGSNERLRIDSSGKLLIGITTNRSIGGINSRLQVEGVDAVTSSLSITRNTDTSSPPYLLFGKSRGGAVNSSTIVQSGDVLGSLEFCGADGNDLDQAAATIQCAVDGTPGSNDMPGRLVFSTTADGASSPTERMRISQDGVVTIQNGAVAVIDVLADGATITPDLAAGCNFSVSISGNRTIANPTNITAGQTGSIFITQGTGSNTLSWGSYWDFPAGTAPTLSTASGAVDRVDYIVRTTTSIHTVFTANYS